MRLYMGNYLLSCAEGLAKLLIPHPTKTAMTIENRETVGEDICLSWNLTWGAADLKTLDAIVNTVIETSSHL